MQAVRLW
ncbi:hypothetical protein VCHC50A1_3798, partial [Vibrio cholerae HC-50A1]